MNFFKLNIDRYSGKHSIGKIVMLGMMLALSIGIHFLTRFFSWPLISFLKFDFSLIPIIITLFIFDFWAALALMIIKLGIQMVPNGEPIFWYGPLVQFLISLATITFIAISYLVISKFTPRSAWALVISLFLSVIFEVIFSSLINWIWSTPLYMKLLGIYDGGINPSDFNSFYINQLSVRAMFAGMPTWHIAAWVAYAPFNIIKFSTVALVSFPVIKMTHVYFTGKSMSFRKQNSDA